MIHVWRLGHKCVENGLCSREMNDYQRRDQTVGHSRTCWQECQSLSLQNITHSNGGNFLRFFKNLLVSLPPWQFSFWNRPVEHQLVGMQAYVSLGTNSSDWHLQTVWLKKRDKNTVQKRECCSAIHLAASGLGPVHCLQCGGGEEGGGIEDCCALEWTHFLNQIQLTLIHIYLAAQCHIFCSKEGMQPDLKYNMAVWDQ